MGVLWAYFRDTLRLPFILRRGALAMLAEGASIVLDAARDVMITLRDQFFPVRCENAYLENFARSRGIARLPGEPDDSWNGRVRFAYLWWSRGGRSGLITTMLVDYFGFTDVRIINLRSEDTTRWAEFRVQAYLSSGQASFTTDQIASAINEMKPAKSKLAEIDYIVVATGNIPVYSFGCVSVGVTTVLPIRE